MSIASEILKSMSVNEEAMNEVSGDFYYVHTSRKSLDPNSKYTQTVKAGDELHKHLKAGNYRITREQISPLGYTDVSFRVKDRGTAQRVINHLNKRLPRASDEWRQDCDLPSSVHNAFGIHYVGNYEGGHPEHQPHDDGEILQ